jgi:hypothetical protein
MSKFGDLVTILGFQIPDMGDLIRQFSTDNRNGLGVARLCFKP